MKLAVAETSGQLSPIIEDRCELGFGIDLT